MEVFFYSGISGSELANDVHLAGSHFVAVHNANDVQTFGEVSHVDGSGGVSIFDAHHFLTSHVVDGNLSAGSVVDSDFVASGVRVNIQSVVAFFDTVVIVIGSAEGIVVEVRVNTIVFIGAFITDVHAEVQILSGPSEGFQHVSIEIPVEEVEMPSPAVVHFKGIGFIVDGCIFEFREIERSFTIDVDAQSVVTDSGVNAKVEGTTVEIEGVGVLVNDDSILIRQFLRIGLLILRVINFAVQVALRLISLTVVVVNRQQERFVIKNVVVTELIVVITIAGIISKQGEAIVCAIRVGGAEASSSSLSSIDTNGDITGSGHGERSSEFTHIDTKAVIAIRNSVVLRISESAGGDVTLFSIVSGTSVDTNYVSFVVESSVVTRYVVAGGVIETNSLELCACGNFTFGNT